MDKRTIIFVLCVTAAFFGLSALFGTNKQAAAQKTTPSVKKEIAKEEAPIAPSQEGHYVLENDYQQLVFCTRGGALCEINLPFQSKENPSSLVLPIEADRLMESDYSYNDHFPQYFYYKGSKDKLNEKTQVGGYYPLLRRNLIMSANGKSSDIGPQNYALNITSEFKELASMSYTVKEFDHDHIVLVLQQPHRTITKTVSFAKDEAGNVVPYVIDLSITIEGDNKGLFLTSGVPEVELISGSFSPSLKYQIMRQGKSEVSNMDMPKEREVVQVSSLYPNWVSNSNGYLGIIINPTTEIGSGYRASFVPGSQAPTRLVLIDSQHQLYKASEYPGYNVALPLLSDDKPQHFRIFAGPFEDHLLSSIDASFKNPTTGESPDFVSAQNFQGWFSFISEPFAKFLMIIMNWCYKVTHSWAASIVLLTIVLRIMLYPLNAWSFKSMKRMQELAPEVSAIQARYKKDQKKAQIEIMNLYRERRVNPFTGCLPILIQMPFLIGMFDLLKSSFPLRGASFIPGWIDNLTAPDVLFSWGYPLPFIGNQFHLLPIILGAVMFFQQRMSSTAPRNVNEMTDQQRQQRFMGNIMVIFFTVMFYHFPSGLNIYWLSSMLLGILQQWFTNRQLDRKRVGVKG